jgi:GNAT superfamily N-acetyltransferase
MTAPAATHARVDTEHGLGSPRYENRRGPTRGAPLVRISPLRHLDRARVLESVGPTVDRLYPHGMARLSARLDEVADGHAGCAVAWSGDNLIGVAVDSPKGSLVAKLSTLWVDPDARRLGVGSALAATVTQRWLARGVERGHITARSSVAAPISALLSRHGFFDSGLVMHRYGSEHPEQVFLWRPDMQIVENGCDPTYLRLLS